MLRMINHRSNLSIEEADTGELCQVWGPYVINSELWITLGKIFRFYPQISENQSQIQTKS